MSSFDTRKLNIELAKKGLKFCIGCEKELEFSKYGKDNSKKNGLTHRCVECKNREYRKWAKTEKGKNNSKRKYQNNKPKHRNWELKRLFGITLEDYNKMLLEQNEVCAICNQKEMNKKYRTLSVDHCHKTGKVRGLLCSNCNLGIGNMKDNINNLKNAINYLEKNK